MASDRFSVEFKGQQELTKRLLALAEQVGSEVGNALRAEGEIEMTEAKRRTPVKTGALRASGHVEGPSGGTTSMVAFNQGAQRATFWRGTGVGNEISVRLVFGGPAASYALAVHENLAAFHRNGQAKYLESVLRESAPHLAARVAARINLTRMAKG